MPRRTHKRRFRKTKSKGRKRSSRKRLKRSSNKVSAALTNLLAVPDYYVVTDAQIIKNSTSSDTIHMPCEYFTISSGDPYSHNDPVVLGSKIPNIITTSNNQSIKYSVEEWTMKQAITSTTTQDVKLTAYLCKWRRDCPQNGTLLTPLSLLGDGFLNNGYGTNAGTGNTFLKDSTSDPFMSVDFTLHCKIVKTKTYLIRGGCTKNFHLKKSKPFMVHPNLFNYLGSAQNYSTGTVLLEYCRGGLFYLFKMESGSVLPGTTAGQLGEAAGNLVLRTFTTYKWTYKFMNNIIGTITEASIPTTQLSAVTGNNFINPISGNGGGVSTYA